jgi:hypothetical protein
MLIEIVRKPSLSVVELGMIDTPFSPKASISLLKSVLLLYKS